MTVPQMMSLLLYLSGSFAVILSAGLLVQDGLKRLEGVHRLRAVLGGGQDQPLKNIKTPLLSFVLAVIGFWWLYTALLVSKLLPSALLLTHAVPASIVGPFLYFYYKSVFFPDFHFQEHHKFHFYLWIPVLLALLSLYFHDGKSKVELAACSHTLLDSNCAPSGLYETLAYFILVLPKLSIVCYLSVLLKEVLLWKKDQPRNWLPYHTHFAILVAMVAVSTALAIGAHFTTNAALTAIQFTGPIVWVFGTYFLNILHRHITGLAPEPPEGPASLSTEKTLSNIDEDELKRRLSKAMEEQKHYRQETLKLGDLARFLSDKNGFQINAHQLSAYLNARMNKNLNEYLNEFRVEEMKERLTDPEYREYTVLRIGLDAGFNAGTTAHREFKKRTGLPPAKYRKRFGKA